MPNKANDSAADQTPLARLHESELHGVVGYQLAQATIVTSQAFEATVGRARALRPVEFTILALVQANPDVTARQLARGLAVTPPNITVWLDKLESRGLVRRSRSTADARQQHIRTTATGSALARAATRNVLDGESAALATLSAAERAMLVELLHKVAVARKRHGSG
jgi:DNA-binding MarR family transcriptional regulator